MTRTLDFRFVIVRGGADYLEINPVSAPTIRCDDSAEIKMSLSGQFFDDERIDWLSDEIRVEVNIDGVAHPLGVYLVSTASRKDDGTTKQVNIEAFDRCWIVKDNYTENLLYFAQGTNYLTAISQLLTTCGIAIVAMTPNDATMQEAREDWNVGTSYLEIINQLLSEINYNPLWFDKDGVAILEPVSVPTIQNVEHSLDNSNVKSLLLPQITQESDIFQAPNVFICICSNADKNAPMVATSVNANPQSPLSVMRRGRRIATVVQVDNIASQEELQTYADTLRNESLIRGETIQVTTGILPDFGVADVVSLIYDDIADICVDRAWDMRLEVGGEMKHTLERVVVAIG